jgi:Transmembrane secretion effector
MGLGPIRDLLRFEPQSRLFFAAHAQSSLGTGAGYVALLILAYERLESPWAISLVLLAEFLPAMFLGPVFGAAADRRSRRWCAATADLARALAFISLFFFESFPLTVAFALVAGVGTGLFRPAVMAGLPSLVSPARLPAATSLYGALADVGFTLGPAIAGVGLLLASPETVMLVNGLSFAVSAVVLTRVPLGGGDRREESRSLLREARAGVRAVSQMRGLRAVIAGSSAVVLFAGLFNVGELLLAEEELGAGGAGFALLAAVFGLGVLAGSLAGAGTAEPLLLKRRYLIGLVFNGVGFLIAAVAPGIVLAAFGFAVAGLGNGLGLVHERLLVQVTVSDRLLGRTFGLRDTLDAWAWTIAFASAGLLFTAFGIRPVLALAGGGVLAIAAASAWVLRDAWAEPVALPAEPLPHLVDRLDVEEPAVV